MGWGHWLGEGIIFDKGRIPFASQGDVLPNRDQHDTVPSDPRNCAALSREN